MRTALFSNSLDAIIKRIDGFLPSISDKLSTLPSKLFYPLYKSGSSNPRSSTDAVTKLRQGTNGRDTVPEHIPPGKDSARSTDVMPIEPNITKDEDDDSCSEVYDQLDLGLFGAPYFITEKKYDQRTILDRKIAKHLRFHLPIIARSSDFWTILYGSNNDGFNLNTLHSLCAERKSQLLVISALPYNQPGPQNTLRKSDQGDVAKNAVFGAFVNEGLKVNDDYYGSSSSFLWREGSISPSGSCTSARLANGSSIDTSFKSATQRRLSLETNIEFVTAMESSADTDRTPETRYDWSCSSDTSLAEKSYVEVYHATGKDSRYVLSDGSFIALGVGRVGKFGLWLSKHLDYGYTSPSATFGNPSLVDGSSEGSHFRVCSIEVWGLG